MREREFLRQCLKSEKARQFQRAQQTEAEKEIKKSIFKIFRMLALHQIIEALFGGKK